MFIKQMIRRTISFCWTKYALRNVKKHGEGCKCNHACRFTPTTELGSNCNFNGMEISGKGKVIFGDNFHSGKSCCIITSFHNYDKGDAIPYDDSFITRDVIIGNNVWLGERVMILGGVTIGEGAVIQAGAVVCSSIPPLSVAGGSPAGVFKQRDAEHYYRLVEEKKFH